MTPEKLELANQLAAKIENLSEKIANFNKFIDFAGQGHVTRMQTSLGRAHHACAELEIPTDDVAFFLANKKLEIERQLASAQQEFEAL